MSTRRQIVAKVDSVVPVNKIKAFELIAEALHGMFNIANSDIRVEEHYATMSSPSWHPHRAARWDICVTRRFPPDFWKARDSSNRSRVTSDLPPSLYLALYSMNDKMSGKTPTRDGLVIHYTFRVYDLEDFITALRKDLWEHYAKQFDAEVEEVLAK